MIIQIEEYKLKNLLIDAAEIAITKYEARHGNTDRFVSEKKAFRIYGATNVRRWQREGLLKIKKGSATNSSKQLEVAEMEALRLTNK